MNKAKIQFLTRTGVLLAVVVVVQMLGRFIPGTFSNFIVGPLVNMCLILAAMSAGIWGGVTIAVLAPFTSLINNHAPIAAALLPFAPFIALSNVILVVCVYYMYNKNMYVGVISGALLKFGFLYGAINLFLNLFDFPKFAEKLIAMFSWPQLITALIGGFIALPVVVQLKKYDKNRSSSAM